jgi:hypothetical protein
MRYRKLSPTGDYTFGGSQLNFWINVPEAVAQAVQTTLKLWLGEWYLNVNAGVPYPEGVIGEHSQAEADATIKGIIQNVQGVNTLTNYTSEIDPVTRAYQTTGGTLNTIYGVTPLEITNYGNF